MIRTIILISFATLIGTSESIAKRVVRPLSNECISNGRLASNGQLPARPKPIADECAAAAVAEHAFLEHTKHLEPKYSIWPMDHTKSEWHFMIMGQKNGAPGPGEHWMITVSRTTGKTEIIDGE